VGEAARVDEALDRLAECDTESSEYLGGIVSLLSGII